MKKISLILATLSLAVAAQAQYPIVIDDFSGDLSAYTATRILNASATDADNVWSWGIAGGALQMNTSTYGGIEQYALTRNDYTLGVGLELTASFSAGYTGTQDIGLYVGAGTPTAGVRANYINIYKRNNGQLFSRGFNGTSEFSLSGGGTPSVSTLFIARTGASTFETGYYDAITGTRTVLTSRNFTSGANVGASIGFYADVRSAGIVGSLDNLCIPEPSTAALLGFGLLGAVMNSRRRK